jgi:hypothetical protein
MNSHNIKIDTHIHSNGVSFCSQVSSEQIIDEKLRLGIDGIILTNHCQSHYYPPEKHDEYIEKVIAEFNRAKEYGEKKNFLVMLGLEVSIFEPSYNDWLLYGVTEEFLRSSPCFYQLNQRSLFELCEKNGILLVQAHPFRNSGWGVNELMHGAEVNCSPGDLPLKDEVIEIACARNLTVTCGTDYHSSDRPNCGMVVPDFIKTSVDFANYLKTTDYTELFFENETVLVPNGRK